MFAIEALERFAIVRCLRYYSPMAAKVRANIVRLFPYREYRTARWIIGRDPYGDKHYLMHNEYPMFLAKIGTGDEGILSGLSYGMSDDRSLYDFNWLDPNPGEIGFLNLMREAEDALLAGSK